METFDEKAKSWDNNPANWARAEAIAQKIRQKIDLNTGLSALEYGAGTGILSFILQDSLKEITLMDSSIEMVKVMEEKIRNGKVSHLKPLFFNLETTEYDSQSFDLVFSQMVMHHVEDIKTVIARFYALLRDGGKIAIADLYSEDGSFHGSGFTGHLGFDPENLCHLLEEAGFENCAHELCYTMKKQTEKSGIMEFPIFLLTATKPG